MFKRCPQWVSNIWFLNLAALAAGAALPFAFAPYEFRLLAIVSPMVLFLVWSKSNPREAALRGFLFGAGMFGFGTYWIYYSLHLFGDAIAPLAFIITVGFVAVFAAYIAGLGWLIVRFFPAPKNDKARSMWFIGFVPSAWTLCELFRGWFLTGFPWLSIGYSQIDSLLAGYAPVLGVYGVSWVTAITAGLLLVVVLSPHRHRAIAFTIGIAIWLGGFVLGKIEWSEPHGEPLTVRIVQGNIEQHQKFMADMLIPSIETYKRLSESDEHVDLIVWPESAIPTFFYKIEEYLGDFAAQKAAEGTKILTGGFIYNRETGEYHNSVRLLDDPNAYYHKQHLVPFGEYMPFRLILNFLSQYIMIPMADLSPGDDSVGLIRVKGQTIGASICYEDAFGEEIIRQLPEANLLLNVSNDSWFGDSAAPYQHLEIARMRALEASRPMLRVTNTGVSALIYHLGSVKTTIDKSQTMATNVIIRPRQGETLFVFWESLLIWISVLATILFYYVAILRHETR